MRTPPLPADYLCQGLQTNLRKTLDTTYLLTAPMGRQQEEKEKEQHYNETGTVVPIVGRQPCQSFYLFI